MFTKPKLDSVMKTLRMIEAPYAVKKNKAEGVSLCHLVYLLEIQHFSEL